MNYLQPIDPQSPEFPDFYDELPLWSAPFGLLLLEHLPLRPAITILDVGAGTGFLTLELAQRCGPTSTIIAVDPWQSALARLTRKAAHLRLQNVRTLPQDIATLDLPPASVDLIVSNLGINNFENPDAALRSCFQAAKPGADLFLTTNLVGHMAEFYDAYRSVLIDLGFTSQLPALDAHINHRATIDSVKTQLERAGFTFLTAITHQFHERFADGSALLRHHFMRLAFLPAWKSIAPPHALPATFTALEHRLNALAAQHDHLSLTIPTALIHASKPPPAPIEQ